MTSGIAVGSASTVTSRSVLLEDAAVALTPGASSSPISSSGTCAWIATSSRTRSRSMCTVSPLTGWRTSSLSTTGVARVTVELKLDHGAALGERVPELTAVDLERAAAPRRRRRRRRGPGRCGAGDARRANRTVHGGVAVRAVDSVWDIGRSMVASGRRGRVARRPRSERPLPTRRIGHARNLTQLARQGATLCA